MKTKLLKRLRKQGRDMITIYSMTTMRCGVVAMSCGYKSDGCRLLFSFGDSEEDVRNKAARIYMEKEVARRRNKKRKQHGNKKR